VVVPTLDEEDVLAALLRRLLPRGPASEHEDHADSVVVADGGSRDRTQSIALEHAAELVTAPAGRGQQLAAGARRLDSDVLVFLHADCIPAAGAIRELRRAFEDERVHACALRQKIDSARAFYRLIEACADWRVRRLGMVYGDSGLCVRRSTYERVGGFQPLPVFEDVDLSERLRALGRPALLSSQLVVSARRWQREGPLRTTLRNWMLVCAYKAGMSPQRLARFYRPHSRPPASP
jgi:rSAM/selenodomain-associated transferase 2